MARRNPRFRITGGDFRGRPIEAPEDLATRPMQGRLRETLFNILRPELAGARVLDLFSGTGSLGLEALSRGAEACTFVERHAPARAVLLRNIERLGAGGRCRVLNLDLLRLRAFPADPYAPFHLIFLDPPFRLSDPAARESLLPLVRSLLGPGITAPEALMVLQVRRKTSPPEAMESFRLERDTAQGSVRLAFYRRPAGRGS